MHKQSNKTTYRFHDVEPNVILEPIVLFDGIPIKLLGSLKVDAAVDQHGVKLYHDGARRRLHDEVLLVQSLHVAHLRA